MRIAKGARFCIEVLQAIPTIEAKRRSRDYRNREAYFSNRPDSRGIPEA
jgi:hypothetical protein